MNQIGHNQGPPLADRQAEEDAAGGRVNASLFASGIKFRISVCNFRLMDSQPEFFGMKADAVRRRKELNSMGYVATVWQIEESGNIFPVRR